jgi:tetratricopeptide (TPR) repeat protein
MVNLKGMISSEVIEKYQNLLRHNPHSQVFAPLADAYLERGLYLQAEELALSGTQRHPLFPGGFLVLGKIQYKMEKYTEAILSLQKAIELSPQNIAAHQNLGDVYLAIKKPLEALHAYKMVLFLNPYSTKAKQAVEKLENASALEFEEETFSMAKLSSLKQMQKNEDSTNKEQSIKRVCQLVDAFLIRGDKEQAAHLLNEALNEFGPNLDFDQRLKKISNRAVAASTAQPNQNERDLKLNKLRDMLRTVQLSQQKRLLV